MSASEPEVYCHSCGSPVLFTDVMACKCGCMECKPCWDQRSEPYKYGIDRPPCRSCELPWTWDANFFALLRYASSLKRELDAAKEKIGTLEQAQRASMESTRPLPPSPIGYAAPTSRVPAAAPVPLPPVSILPVAAPRPEAAIDPWAFAAVAVGAAAGARRPCSCRGCAKGETVVPCMDDNDAWRALRALNMSSLERAANKRARTDERELEGLLFNEPV